MSDCRHAEKPLKPEMHAEDALILLFFSDHSKRAFETIKKAAEEGDALALYMMASYYQSGNGVVLADRDLARKYLKKSYEAGYPVAGYEYWCSLTEDERKKSGIPAKVKKNAMELAESGDPFAQYALWFMWCFGDDEEETREFDDRAVEWLRRLEPWYRRAAEQGDAEAQFQFGMYLGSLPSGNDEEDARTAESSEWILKAAENGHAEAQFTVGVLCAHGDGAGEAPEEAGYWFRKAAEQGHIDAQRLLGDCYHEGNGVVQSDEEAVKWYQKAAEQGSTAAQDALGDCYEHGIGVEQSDEKARFWHALAQSIRMKR
jgi:TPR repeat protein